MKSFNRNRILEIIWLIVAMLSIVAGIHKTYVDSGFRESYLFFIITFIAVLMYLFRRKLRKKERGKINSDSK
jgi:hypothetical protein